MKNELKTARFWISIWAMSIGAVREVDRVRSVAYRWRNFWLRVSAAS